MLIVAGASLYVYFDGTFRMESYMYVLGYLVSICSEMVYVKHVLSETASWTTWDRVYYNNVLSIFPVLLFGWAFGDHVALLSHEWTTESIVFLALSSAVGVAISFSGFYLRNLVTATTFTVVGVVNKIATTALNVTIWDRHADAFGLAALMLCIFAGVFYEPSAPRKR